MRLGELWEEWGLGFGGVSCPRERKKITAAFLTETLAGLKTDVLWAP